jgi:valyl-tRNA synthetase
VAELHPLGLEHGHRQQRVRVLPEDVGVVRPPVLEPLLLGELDQLETQLQTLSKRLQNEGFVSRAPATVVESERKKEDEWIKRREQLAAKVKALCGG